MCVYSRTRGRSVFAFTEKIPKFLVAFLPPSVLIFFEGFRKSAPTRIPNKNRLFFGARVPAFGLKKLQKPDRGNVILKLFNLSALILFCHQRLFDSFPDHQCDRSSALQRNGLDLLG